MIYYTININNFSFANPFKFGGNREMNAKMVKHVLPTVQLHEALPF